ncbi:hypothetical protein ACHAXA_000928 [Cyclostephanos tholiformis]|uniref:Uncharacterized protein n=1 Tax=Cyclostephanos tholiformis TaxID=382380 RepID=A0ABD3RHD3_9STRA
MGDALSTIRWTPSYKRPGAEGGGSSSSPGNSTSNLSYDTYGSDHHHDHDGGHHHHGGSNNNYIDEHGGNSDHLGTSGKLMGVNAPPLYDACLVGRWDEVLRICGEPSVGADDQGWGKEGGPGPGPGGGEEEMDRESNDTNDASHTRTAMTSETGLLSSSSGSGSGVEHSLTRLRHADAIHPPSIDDGDDDVHYDEDKRNGPAVQVRYADRRLNTPLHLACRRQPPPRVIQALLNRSPRDAVTRRTADGLTPLHFAAYCGAGPEVVGLLLDRMRSDAAVIRDTTFDVSVVEREGGGLATPLDVFIPEDDRGHHRQPHSRRLSSSNMESASPSSLLASSSSLLPPARLLDRRRRTPLHCALSGFRTPIRPVVVRKLLAADPGSATLGDERGRTPLSLLFDDYAEEVMEALEDDVTSTEARDRCTITGGDLYECWEMLGALLQAAYQGIVESGEGQTPTPPRCNDAVDPSSSSIPPPQDRTHHHVTTGEVNVMDMYDRERFSIVHAAAGVWECPAPLARLVLKCTCGGVVREGDLPSNDDDDACGDPIRQPDEETMRLPLHIAVCAQPKCRDGFSARLKLWLSSSTPDAYSWTTTARSADARHLSSRGRSATPTTAAIRSRRGEVYNPRFGRSPSRDSVVAYSSSLQRNREDDQGQGGVIRAGRGVAMIPRSTSNSSMSANIVQEEFLQHTIVKDVLELYPAAASIVDHRTGKLPVVLAIEHGKSWEMAVGPLLEAYSAPFGGGGDGGMALPDDGPEGHMHRTALQGALTLGLSSLEVLVRKESIRTAGKLAEWGGVFGMPGSLDGVVSEWLDALINRGPASTAASSGAEASLYTPEGNVVGPGALAAPPTEGDWIQTQASLLSAVSEIVTHSRPDSITDRVARLCLNTSREYLSSKDKTVREAAACVLGSTLNSVGDAEDAANVMREVVLNLTNDEGSICSSGSTVRGGGRAEEDIISKHGRLVACKSILSTQWGYELMATDDIRNATIAFIHKCAKDKNTIVRRSVYYAVGPILGKSTCDSNVVVAEATAIIKELRSIILKGTRASENVEVQLALARGLTSAARMHPDLFLCKAGMPILDAALMLAMSSSSSRSPNVQRAFQLFLWVALQMGGHQVIVDVVEKKENFRGETNVGDLTCCHHDLTSPGLQKYIQLAEGENGRIMLKFVTYNLLKIEDDQAMVSVE